MTLLARDEADIVEAWLDFHLSAGADLVVATDNRSEDGTTEILERYAREGHVHLIREPGEDLRQDEWVTRMARLAATDFGADWVINSDADELWWPRGTSYHEVLGAVPERYGTVAAFLRMFVPRPGDEPFAERMTVRFSVARADQRSRVAVQADSQGRPPRSPGDPPHAREPRSGRQPVRAAARLVPDRGVPLPARSPEQAAHKAELQGRAFENIERAPTAYDASMIEALRSGRIGEYYESLVVDDAELERGRERPPRRRTRGCETPSARSPPVIARLPDPDARRGRGVRGRGRRPRRGRRCSTAAPPGRAREPPVDARAAAADRRLPQGVRDGEALPGSLALYGAQADDHLVQAVGARRAPRVQVARREAVQDTLTRRGRRRTCRPRRSRRRTLPRRAAWRSDPCSATTRRTSSSAADLRDPYVARSTPPGARIRRSVASAARTS